MGNPYDYILPDLELSCKALKGKILSYCREGDDEKTFTSCCEEIANVMGVTTRTVINWCTVSPPNGLDKLITLSYLLDCDIKELYVCRSQFKHPEYPEVYYKTKDADDAIARIKWKDDRDKKYHIKNLQSFLRYACVCDRMILEDVLFRVGDYDAAVIDDYVLKQMERIRLAVPEQLREDIDDYLYYNYSVPSIENPVFSGTELYEMSYKYNIEEINSQRGNCDNPIIQLNIIKDANCMFEKDFHKVRKLYYDISERCRNRIGGWINPYDNDFLTEFKDELKKIIEKVENCISYKEL